jgi:serine/threonine protein kinase
MDVADLRTILVDDWRLLTHDQFDKLQRRFAGDCDEITSYLSAKARHVTWCDSLPVLTPSLADALRTGRSAAPILRIGSASWLILAELATRGQGTVSLASSIDDGHNRLVCIKQVRLRDGTGHPIAPQDADAIREHLRSEIDVLQECFGESGLPTLIAADRPTGTFVMEFLDGPDCETRLRDTWRWPIIDAINVISVIGRVLVIMHDRKRIHKDIKPGNIIVAKDGRPCLIDFGLAEDWTVARSIASGTPHYISPEVLACYFDPASGPGRYSAKADVYGLAATAYALLVGQPPYHEFILHPGSTKTVTTQWECRRFTLGDDARDCDARAVRRDVPPPLSRLLRSALRHDPDDRPSMFEFAEAAERIRVAMQFAADLVAPLRILHIACIQQANDAANDANSIAVHRAWDNANAFVSTLSKITVSERAILAAFAAREAEWLEYADQSRLVSDTVRYSERFESTISSLRNFLDHHPTAAERTTAATRQAGILIVQTIEAVRQLGLEARTLAHDWKSTVESFGIRG